MKNIEQERQIVVGKIAEFIDLEPEHFAVKWHPKKQAVPLGISGENVIALAYGKHEISFDENDRKRICGS